jgi:hypothetical protein
MKRTRYAAFRLKAEATTTEIEVRGFRLQPEAVAVVNPEPTWRGECI